jgi:hypothetical protein
MSSPTNLEKFEALVQLKSAQEALINTQPSLTHFLRGVPLPLKATNSS